MLYLPTFTMKKISQKYRSIIPVPCILKSVPEASDFLPHGRWHARAIALRTAGAKGEFDVVDRTFSKGPKQVIWWIEIGVASPTPPVRGAK